MNPDKHTNQELMVDVGDGHQLYVHDWGNADASLPIIFLHGGPGANTKDRHKQRFDPSHQRVIFFDQRGCGNSAPLGTVTDNTSDKLVADIQTIKDTLELGKIVVTGGSWGVCLGLLYALQHPDDIAAMVLQGIYTGSKAETAHIDNGGFKNYFPDVWEQYVARTPKAHSNDPSAYHMQQAFSDDPEAAKQSIYAYAELEGSLLSIDDRHAEQDYETFDPNSMKIELHYLKNNCFLEDRFILDNAHKLTMPIWLVQGRYDMVCPPVTAYELNKRLPNSQLVWTTAGHGNDRPNFDVTKTLLLQIAGK